MSEIEALFDQISGPDLHEEAQFLRRSLEIKGEQLTVTVSTGQEATIQSANDQAITPAFKVGLKSSDAVEFERVMLARFDASYGEGEERQIVVGTTVSGQRDDGENLSEQDEAVCAEAVEKAAAKFREVEDVKKKAKAEKTGSKVLGLFRRKKS